jgi:hypothetical protein
VVVPIKTDLVELFLAVAMKLDEITNWWEKCNNGYGGVRWIPEEYEKEKWFLD